MKKIVFCLMIASLPGNGGAAVTLVEIEVAEPLMGQNGQSAQKQRPQEIKSAPKQIEQLHIEGYIDKQYVRLVVDIVKDKLVNGYLFENKGVKRYVYGEKINGVLHIYDSEGRHLTVVLDNK